MCVAGLNIYFILRVAFNEHDAHGRTFKKDLKVLHFAKNAGLSSKYHHAQAKEQLKLHNDTNPTSQLVPICVNFYQFPIIL